MVENVLASEGFSREMSISMTEFERALRLAETDRTITVTAGRFRVEGDGAVLDVSLTPLPDRVIGMIRLPALAAHLRFLAGNGAERRTLLHRIDLAMRRGGG